MSLAATGKGYDGAGQQAQRRRLGDRLEVQADMRRAAGQRRRAAAEAEERNGVLNSILRTGRKQRVVKIAERAVGRTSVDVAVSKCAGQQRWIRRPLLKNGEIASSFPVTWR